MHLYKISKHINIVAFDVPFPANYGGVIDVYYKIVELQKQNIKVHLHCFKYGRNEASELENICEKVYYYNRNNSLINQFSFLPFTVKSRLNKTLLNNLLSNNYPILFEVLHTCYLLKASALKNRFKIYRHSNIEHDYYNALAKGESNWLKKIYFKIEAIKLKSFEKIVQHAQLILTVNKKDTLYFKTKYPKVKTEYLPSFHAFNQINLSTFLKNQILFHGNLSVSENYNAAIWIINEIVSKTNNEFIFAGLNPNQKLVELINKTKNCKLITNPNETDLQNLIKESFINILYTHQATGLKLKLLNVLYNANTIICNSKMIEGTDIEAKGGVILANSPNEFIKAIAQVNNASTNSNLLLERQKLLHSYNNQINAEKLISLLK
ncbi:MAG: glycosyltransferase family 1 protein [Bacteroidia bacterium]